MPPRPRAKNKRRSGKASDSSSVSTMDQKFEQAFAVVDAATTAALISGISPDCVLSSLSCTFLNVAANARSQDFQKWVQDPDYVWEPVLGAVLKVIEELEEPVGDEGKLLELHYLRDDCKIKSTKMSEVEDFKNSKLAFSTFAWLLKALDDQECEPLFIECAFLVEWFKVSAVLNECSDSNYLLVRQNVPLVAEAWDQLLAWRTD